MGLFDFDMSTPQGQGFNNALLAAAQALLTPRSRGGGMGAAFGAFPQAIDRAKANAMREQLMALQGKQVGLQTDKLGFDMEQARVQQEAARARQAQFAQLVGGLPPDQQGIAQALGPDYFKGLAPQAVKPTFQKWYENGQERSGFVAPGQAPQPVGDAKPLDMNQYLIPDGQGGWKRNDAYIGAKQSVAAAGASRTEFGFPVQEKEYDKSRGKALAEQFGEIQAGARKGFNEVATLNRMDQLLKQVSTGTFTPAMTTVKAIGDALGFKVEGVGPAQALDSLSNQMALQLRSTGDGAGMPGALSDKDRQFLVAMTPGLSKTPEGNKLIIETMRRLAQRKIDVARFAQEYERKNGRLDSGFELALGEYVNSRPLFDDMAVPSAQEPSAEAPMSPQDYLKQHGGK